MRLARARTLPALVLLPSVQDGVEEGARNEGEHACAETRLKRITRGVYANSSRPNRRGSCRCASSPPRKR